MATTLQPTNRNATGASLNQSQTNPQMKRLVYSKYRELLGSYNNQAQAIIDTLPAYMVHRDNGFNLNDNTIVTDAENQSFNENNETTHGFGQGMSATRQMHEAPACVQNAMMTKDKKPFTYTPGGIDLSQIKSERMAKRLARNAQAEGVSSQRSLQPQSPNNVGSCGSGFGASSATASIGAAALGMPFQVLPSPPPPSPPQSTLSGSGTLGKHVNGNAVQAPPPPPPMLHHNTQNFNNSLNTVRKSSPSNFEPPPIGFRPEIKIPSNPMAALRKVPPPVEKNDFWKEEYVREHSKSPLPDTHTKDDYKDPSNDITDALKNTSISTTEQQFTPNNAHNNFSTEQQMFHKQKQQEQHQQKSHQQQFYSPTTTSIQVATGNKTPQPYISPSPATADISSKIEFRSVAPPQTPQTASPYANDMMNSPRQQSQTQRAGENPFKFNQQQQQQQSQLQQQSSTKSPSATITASQSVPWRNPRANQQQTSTQQQTISAQPIYNNIQQQQQQQQHQQQTQQSNQFNNQITKPTNVGSLYIAPLTPTTEAQRQHTIRQQQQQQQQPRQPQPPVQQLRWLSSQPVPREQPEWAHPEENSNVIPSSINRLKSPPPPQPPSSTAPSQAKQQQYNNNNSTNNIICMNPTTTIHTFGGGNQGHATTGLRLQINNTLQNQANATNTKERIIPIQLEQTPPTTQTTSQVMFNTNNSAPGYIIRSPNQFVDQGYNNYTGSSNLNQSHGGQQLNAPRMVQQQQLQQQQQQQHQQQAVTGSRTHIIPITIEGNGTGTRGPITKKPPVIIPNDQRNTSPIQSKSFRILQKITDTEAFDKKDNNNNNNSSVNINYVNTDIGQLQKPHYARQMSAQQAHHSPNWDKVKRQCSSNDIQEPKKPQQQQGNYKQVENYNLSDVLKTCTGNSIPFSFKMLQTMITPENVGPGQSDL